MCSGLVISSILLINHHRTPIPHDQQYHQVGNPIDLPTIPNPTKADIDKWHALYVEKLVDLFERCEAHLYTHTSID